MYIVVVIGVVLFFFFKQKTAYEMRISDWSSDVCSSDLWLRSTSSRCAKPRGWRRRSAGGCRSGLRPRHRPMSECPGVGDVAPTYGSTGASRSEERRVGKECVRTCRSGWAQYHLKKTHNEHEILVPDQQQ